MAAVADYITLPSYAAAADLTSFDQQRYWQSAEETNGNSISGVDDAETTCLVDLLLTATSPVVVTMSMNTRAQGRVLQDFITKLSGKETAHFVLVMIGSMRPLNSSQQDQLEKLPGLKAVYSQNLHKPRRQDFFFPHPLGFWTQKNGESVFTALLDSIQWQRERHPSLVRRDAAAVQPPMQLAGGQAQGAHAQVLAALPSWEKRQKKLFIPPLSGTNYLRRAYIRVLSRPEYAHLVEFAPGDWRRQRLKKWSWWQQDRVESKGEYGHNMARFQAVLSPPGVGYDCYRTWEALLVGSVPFITANDEFDTRVHEAAGAVFIPRPHQLTPSKLQQMLESLTNPVQFSSLLTMDHWQNRYRSHFQ